MVVFLPDQRLNSTQATTPPITKNAHNSATTRTIQGLLLFIGTPRSVSDSAFGAGNDLFRNKIGNDSEQSAEERTAQHIGREMYIVIQP